MLDGMGATGVRGLRIAKEVPGCRVLINDVNPDCVEFAGRNVRENDLQDNVEVSLGDVRGTTPGRYFDYIDIDPFGTPAPFVESALRSVRRSGVLAVTATDTATLFGSYPGTCRRRYDSRPIKCYLSHEMGVRILTGFVIRRAAAFDLAASPLLAYSNDHYYRAFFVIKKGAGITDELLKDIHYVLYDEGSLCWRFKEFADLGAAGSVCQGDNCRIGGPLFSGTLIHPDVANALSGADLDEMCGGFSGKERCIKILDRLAGEAKGRPFFHCTHEIGRRVVAPPPSILYLIDKLAEKGVTGTRTHFSPTGIKTDRCNTTTDAEIGEMIGDMMRT